MQNNTSTYAERQAARAERFARAEAQRLADAAALASKVEQVVESCTWIDNTTAWPSTMRRVVTLITYGDGRQRRRTEITRNGQIVSSSEDRA